MALKSGSIQKKNKQKSIHHDQQGCWQTRDRAFWKEKETCPLIKRSVIKHTKTRRGGTERTTCTIFYHRHQPYRSHNENGRIYPPFRRILTKIATESRKEWQDSHDMKNGEWSDPWFIAKNPEVKMWTNWNGWHIRRKNQMRNDSSIVWTPMATFCTYVSSKTTQRWSIFARQCGNPVQLDWVSLSRCFVSWLSFYYSIRSDFRSKDSKEGWQSVFFTIVDPMNEAQDDDPCDVEEPREWRYRTKWKNVPECSVLDQLDRSSGRGLFWQTHSNNIILDNSEPAECLAKSRIQQN